MEFNDNHLVKKLISYHAESIQRLLSLAETTEPVSEFEQRLNDLEEEMITMKEKQRLIYRPQI